MPLPGGKCNDEIKESTMANKPRRPWIAVLLTLCLPGLGHLYYGKLKRGIFLLGIGQAVLVSAIVSALFAIGVFYVRFAVALGIAVIIFCIIDVIAIARRNEEHDEPGKSNRWPAYIGSIVVALWVVYACGAVILAVFFVKAYKIPAGSMEPTLLIGDRLMVNTFIYKRMVPKRGDVVVFKYPVDPKIIFVKRLIGEPGERVEIIGRTVFINGTPLTENYVQFVDPQSIHSHLGPYHVPPGKYFVMGDNRDNSMDSRYWGYVPRNNLIGKPMFVYLSFEVSRKEYLESTVSDSQRELAEVFQNPFETIRWRRIFHVIK
jgi:signal peptidase I